MSESFSVQVCYVINLENGLSYSEPFEEKPTKEEMLEFVARHFPNFRFEDTGKPVKWKLEEHLYASKRKRPNVRL